MMNKPLGVFVFLSFLTVVAGPGCGLVSTTSISNGPDGGTLPQADGSTTPDRDAGGNPTGSDASPRKDSGPIPPDDAGAGDICTPPASVTYTKKWIPPHPHQAACAQSDLDLYFKICLGVQSDGGAACKSFMATPNGKTCSDCILPSTVTNLGALVPDGQFVSPNVAGCIAIAQNTVPDGAGCASAVLYLEECEQAACGACSQDANSTTDQINACDTAATNGACSAESAAAKCEDQLVDAGGPGASCANGLDFASSYAAIAPIFCLK